MIDSAFNLGEELNARVIPFILHRRLWNKYDLSQVDLNFANWTTIKYLNEDCSGFHADVELLPSNTGGLYLFTIKCNVIPGVTDFPVYIGRAQKTAGQNLRKRCKEYFQKYAKSDERPKITRMFKYWADDLYLNFLPLTENAGIIDFEKKLINSLLLPFNDEIPDIEIRQSIKAFNL